MTSTLKPKTKQIRYLQIFKKLPPIDLYRERLGRYTVYYRNLSEDPDYD